jgi:hypothetical protein
MVNGSGIWGCHNGDPEGKPRNLDCAIRQETNKLVELRARTTNETVFSG